MFVDPRHPQQHNASRNEDRWAYSLRDDPVNVSLNGLLFVDLSNNAVSDRGAAALAAFLPQDNWLQGVSSRWHRSAHGPVLYSRVVFVDR